LEAWVDFPEEGLEFASQDELLGQLEEVRANIASLIDSFHDGRIVSDGLSIALIGTPNVGKSSLMNALLDKERAIVTHIAGTTRDILEDHMRLNGLHIKLLDTAGVREAEDVVEREGVRRSLEAMQAADLVLMVMDATRGLEAEDRALLQRVPKAKTVYIWNKVDAASVPLELDVDGPLIEVSAKEGRGLDGLRAAIDAVIWRDGPPAKDQIVLTSARHKEALQNAEEALGRVISGLQGEVSPEFVTMDMRACLTALGKVIGTDITESILSSIFSRFCIGK
jgi:tRNA modification GTPase